MSKRCFYSDWDALVSKEMTAQINSIVFVKNRRILNVGSDDTKSISIFHREIRWTNGMTEKSECIEFEADPRCLELLLMQLDLSSLRGLTTTFEKNDSDDIAMMPFGRRCGRDLQKVSHVTRLS